MVENLLSNAGDVGSTPGQGTKIPHTMGQLSLHTTNEPECSRACEPQLEKPVSQQRPSTKPKLKKKKKITQLPSFRRG